MLGVCMTCMGMFGSGFRTGIVVAIIIVHPRVDPPGPTSGSYRVMAGRRLRQSRPYCAVGGIAATYSPDARYANIGVRLVRIR